MCAETYSHLGPRGRIHNIERDVEKERTEVIVKFKANVLGAQSTVALFGWDFKELRLGCSNKERRVVKQQYDERLSAAKVAWEAAKHDSKSAFRAAESARLRPPEGWGELVTRSTADRQRQGLRKRLH